MNHPDTIKTLRHAIKQLQQEMTETKSLYRLKQLKRQIENFEKQIKKIDPDEIEKRRQSSWADCG